MAISHTLRMSLQNWYLVRAYVEEASPGGFRSARLNGREVEVQLPTPVRDRVIADLARRTVILGAR